MALTVSTEHIALDEGGTAWVEGTNTKVVEIVLDMTAFGSSPEEIHFQYPHLSLSAIHAALAYYYDHREELDRQMAHQYERAEQLRREAPESPFQRRVRPPGTQA